MNTEKMTRKELMLEIASNMEAFEHHLFTRPVRDLQKRFDAIFGQSPVTRAYIIVAQLAGLGEATVRRTLKGEVKDARVSTLVAVAAALKALEDAQDKLLPEELGSRSLGVTHRQEDADRALRKGSMLKEKAILWECPVDEGVFLKLDWRTETQYDVEKRRNRLLVWAKRWRIPLWTQSTYSNSGKFTGIWVRKGVESDLDRGPGGSWGRGRRSSVLGQDEFLAPAPDVLD